MLSKHLDILFNPDLFKISFWPVLNSIQIRRKICKPHLSGRSALAHHAHTGTSAENKETNFVTQAKNIFTIGVDYYDVVAVIPFVTLTAIP